MDGKNSNWINYDTNWIDLSHLFAKMFSHLLGQLKPFVPQNYSYTATTEIIQYINIKIIKITTAESVCCMCVCAACRKIFLFKNTHIRGRSLART